MMFIEDAHADMPGNPPKDADHYKQIYGHSFEEETSVIDSMNENAVPFLFIFIGLMVILRSRINSKNDKKKKNQKIKEKMPTKVEPK